MKAKTVFILTLIFVLSISSSFAQSLTPFVISSSGGFYSNSSGQLSFTTAEMTMVKTFSAGNSILTQGFQQPFDFGVFVTSEKNATSSFNVYPNPSAGDFNLLVESKSASAGEVVVYDAMGKEVFKEKMTLMAGKQILPLQLSALNQGIYLLQLNMNNSHEAAYLYNYYKIQIIK